VEVIFILIGVSLVVAVGFLVAFLWAMRSGQYEDDVTPSMRILNDQSPKHSVKTDKNEA
jgi:cbb3-type cytochrome oxidase maturation protein